MFLKFTYKISYFCRLNRLIGESVFAPRPSALNALHRRVGLRFASVGANERPPDVQRPCPKAELSDHTGNNTFQNNKKQHRRAKPYSAVFHGPEGSRYFSQSPGSLVLCEFTGGMFLVYPGFTPAFFIWSTYLSPSFKINLGSIIIIYNTTHRQSCYMSFVHATAFCVSESAKDCVLTIRSTFLSFHRSSRNARCPHNLCNRIRCA